MHLGVSGGKTVSKQEQKKSLSIFALSVLVEATVSPVIVLELIFDSYLESSLSSRMI